GGGSAPLPARSPIAGDLDRKVLLLAVPLVGLTDRVSGLIVSEQPGTPITAPDGRNPHGPGVGIGAEPGGTIARGAEDLGDLDELVQGHRLTEGESFGEHPLRRFDLAGER